MWRCREKSTNLEMLVIEDFVIGSNRSAWHASPLESIDPRNERLAVVEAMGIVDIVRIIDQLLETKHLTERAPCRCRWGAETEERVARFDSLVGSRGLMNCSKLLWHFTSREVLPRL